MPVDVRQQEEKKVDALSAVESSGPLEVPEFLRQIANDRDRAFGRLMTMYQQEIYDLCVRISGSRSEAEDLTQETFVRAYEHLEDYRGEASPRSWLYRIAMNCSITFTRRLKRWRMRRGNGDELFPELPELTTPSPERAVTNRDEAERAHKLLAELPTRQRAAVVLRTIKELSYEDVAQIMGISVGGAKANVHQGLKRLRILLEEK